MLRDSKLRFDRLSPFARFATIGAVLLCGLLVAGLRGPGNSSSALAEDQTKITQDESKKTFRSPTAQRHHSRIARRFRKSVKR